MSTTPIIHTNHTIMRNYVIGVVVGISLFLLFEIGKENTLESGILEILQLVVLTLAFMIWANVAMYLHKKSLLQDYFPIAFALFMMVLIFLFLGRESSWLRIWGMGNLSGIRVKSVGTVIIILALAYIGWQWFFRVPNKREVLISFLKSASCWLIILSGVWMVLGQAFEDYRSLPHHRYYEELSELTAHVTLVYAAFHSRLALIARSS